MFVEQHGFRGWKLLVINHKVVVLWPIVDDLSSVAHLVVLNENVEIGQFVAFTSLALRSEDGDEVVSARIKCFWNKIRALVCVLLPCFGALTNAFDLVPRNVGNYSRMLSFLKHKF